MRGCAVAVLVDQEADGLRKLNLGRDQILTRLWELATLSHDQGHHRRSAGLVEVPAVPVPVVDTVGAGDAFNAGFAVGLSEKKSTLEAIALGVTAASLSTQRRETIASYSYRSEVDLSYEKTLRAAFAVEPQRIVEV